jgi:transglutaminase-like putative cysteine protease
MLDESRVVVAHPFPVQPISVPHLSPAGTPDPRGCHDGPCPPPGQDKLIGADASHAWFAVYHPGLGWFDFDPTNNHCPDDRHITVAWGRDYGDVTPLKGVVYGGGQQQATVSVEVINLLEG